MITSLLLVLAVIKSATEAQDVHNDFLKTLRNAQRRSFRLIERMQNAAGLHHNHNQANSRSAEAMEGTDGTDNDLELIELLRKDQTLRTGFDWLKEVEKKETSDDSKMATAEKMAADGNVAANDDSKMAANENVELFCEKLAATERVGRHEIDENGKKSNTPVSVVQMSLGGELEKLERKSYEPIVVHLPVYLKLDGLKSDGSSINSDEKHERMAGHNGKDRKEVVREETL